MIQLSSLSGGAVALLDIDMDTPVGVVVYEGCFFVFDGMDRDIIYFSATSGYVVPADMISELDLDDLPGLPDLMDLPDL